MVEAIILFIVGLVLICAGGDRLVDAAVAIAKKLGIPQIQFTDHLKLKKEDQSVGASVLLRRRTKYSQEQIWR